MSYELLDKVGDATHEVVTEVRAALAKFGPFNTAHEGYALLLEEVDELWDEIKLNQARRNPPKLRREAIQVAAMALELAALASDPEFVTK